MATGSNISNSTEHMEALRLESVSPVLGIYVDGLSLSSNNLAASAARIRDWLDQYLVVIVRGQNLSAAEQRDLVA